MSYVVPVTDATYLARVVDSPAPVLLVFLPDGGEVRRAFSPVLSEVAQRLGDGVVVATIDVATNPATTQRWGVTQTPTSVLLHLGIVQRVLLGVRTADPLIEEVKQAVGPEHGDAVTPKPYARHPDVLAAQHFERARIRSDRQHRQGAARAVRGPGFDPVVVRALRHATIGRWRVGWISSSFEGNGSRTSAPGWSR